MSTCKHSRIKCPPCKALAPRQFQSFRSAHQHDSLHGKNQNTVHMDS